MVAGAAEALGNDRPDRDTIHWILTAQEDVAAGEAQKRAVFGRLTVLLRRQLEGRE